MTNQEYLAMTIESGPLPDDLHGGSIVTVIRPPIDRLGQYMSVSTLYKRDNKMWLLRCHDIQVPNIFSAGLVVAEAPLVTTPG